MRSFKSSRSQKNRSPEQQSRLRLRPSKGVYPSGATLLDWMFHCYILKCADGTYYVGHTDDMEKRLAQHQSGAFSGYTYKRRPVELMWNDAFHSRDDAKAAEKQIKGWSRAKKEALIRRDWDRVSELAKCRSRNR